MENFKGNFKNKYRGEDFTCKVCKEHPDEQEASIMKCKSIPTAGYATMKEDEYYELFGEEIQAMMIKELCRMIKYRKSFQ